MTIPLTYNRETPENRENEREPPQKRIKITANNGWRVIHEMKCGRLDKLNSASPTPLRRANSRGKLARLISLPMDVLFEIFGHLLPFDVLHLARATKEFRRVLLHRSAISTWKAAFTNVPKLPECPPDMSLPEWANLAFDLHCHNCGNSRVKNVVDFFVRIRLCGPCAKTCLLSSKTFDEKVPKDKLILKCVPFTKWNKGAMKSCLIQDRDEFLKNLANPKRNRQEFVDSKRAEVKVRTEHGKRCHAWLDEEAAARERELDAIRQVRKNAIVDKLADLGYGEECDYLRDLEDEAEPRIKLLSKHQSVRVPKPLTEQTWSSIKSNMIHYMDQVRVHMAREDRLKLLETRKATALRAWYTYRQKNIATYRSLPMPSPVDIWDMPKVQKIIERPSSDEVTFAMFKELFDKEMFDFLEEFGRAHANKLAFKHPCDWPIRSMYDVNSLRKLELAICVFACTDRDLHYLSNDIDILVSMKDDYEQPLFYPEFLHHPCNSICEERERYTPEDRELQLLDDNEALSVNAQFSDCRRAKWSSGNLVPHEKAGRVVQKIVEACELNPKITTVMTMDEVDPRLICLKCTFGGKADGERRCSVFSWRNAVTHCLKTHWGVAVPWQRISAEDEAEAKVLELNEPARRKIPPPQEKMWRCTTCLDTPSDLGRMTKKEIDDHYERRSVYDHGHSRKKDGLEEGPAYYRALECPPPQPLTVKMIPKAVK